MSGILINNQSQWETGFRPYFREAEASQIFSVGDVETIVFHMGQGITGCFQAVPGKEHIEIYYVISGKIILQPIDEPEKPVLAGGFFALNDRLDGTVFSIPEDTELICYTNQPDYDAAHDTTVRVDSMLEELQLKDGDTRLHGERVRMLSMQAAANMPDFDGTKLEMLLQAARFHDVGKCRIPLEILIKPGKLTDEEYELMKQHSRYGAEIVGDMFDGEMAEVLLHHHEHYDGTGYPDGLKGDDIPLCDRVIAVADAYDAMVTTRPYHLGISREAAIAELKRCSGTQFDPKCVTAFIKSLKETSHEEKDDLIIQETKRQNYGILK